MILWHGGNLAIQSCDWGAWAEKIALLVGLSLTNKELVTK